MKNTLIALFLTMTFAFGRGPSSSANTKVLSIVTNGTEVITITETTSESLRYVAAGIRSPVETNVTTNIAVSTIPSEGHIINVDEWVKEHHEAMLKAQKEVEERKKQQKKKAEALKNAYEFLSKPISKKEEK